ncbi:MAG: c-type cytochrome [Verrucomicrobia bacterium]|nr:c-type cytochrome [Verrucomicrobiota bacterium]
MNIQFLVELRCRAAVTTQWAGYSARFKFLACLLILGVTNGAEFPEVYNSEPDTESRLLSAAESAAAMKLPEGFHASVFASEPDVQNPIAMTWDGRGRLWVAENFTYAERGRHFDLSLRDRILIFEDNDGDGRFDSRKVFSDEVQMLTSVEVGRGGIWVMCPPQLLFISDRNMDDQPDGEAEVVLDGFSVPEANYHNFANGLRWGPDGWLYGRCGGSAPGDIGLPGTPPDGRIPLRGGMWRYHPERKVFESLVTGTTNPWGHDWDKYGELFFINTVNGHLWHVFPGAHFVRMSKLDPNPRAYRQIDMHADHWHFDSSLEWMKSRDGAANAYGGGHAHIGMMIYQGDNWPAEYRDRLFTINMHGRRLNQEILERNGSGYAGRHGEDFMLSEDTWFRGLDLSTGPDGGVFLIDWSDIGECHESTGVHRTSGRIYKITHGQIQNRPGFDLSKLDERALVALHRNANQWHVHQARIELANRAAAGVQLEDAKRRLRAVIRSEKDAVQLLEAVWTLNAIDGVNDEMLRKLVKHSSENVRAWAIRLLTDRWPLDTLLSARPPGAGDTGISESGVPSLLPLLKDLARHDPSALVRLTIASTLQRLPVSERPELAALLAAHPEDANDHNLPLMIWYGLIPVADQNAKELLRVAAVCEMPETRRAIARRLGEDIERDSEPLNELILIAARRSEVFQDDILSGLSEALVGWRSARKPAAWSALEDSVAATDNPALKQKARDLNVVFGDGRALDSIQELALSVTAELPFRQAALRTLIENRPPDLRQICEQLLFTRELNTLAVKGLAYYDDPELGIKLANAYPRFHTTAQPTLIETLVSRKEFAKPLLENMAAGKIPRTALSAFAARQIRSFNDAALNERLSEAWGVLRESGEEKKRTISEMKRRLSREALANASPSRGRVLFKSLCSACHTLYGEGGQAGPDLTGAGRDNIDYLLENIVDPSGVVSADFKMVVVSLSDGRVLNGLLAGKTDRTLTLRTASETMTVELREIESISNSSLSLMPDGLLEALDESQACDLIAYLMRPNQVPLPTGANHGIGQ